MTVRTVWCGACRKRHPVQNIVPAWPEEPAYDWRKIALEVAVLGTGLVLFLVVLLSMAKGATE